MTDWSTLKKLIWLRIIKGGGSALRTVTGAIVHVTNALAMPAKALTVNVEPIQDLHGYDAPWPAGGGKNLFPLPTAAETKNGVTVEATSSGEIWVHGTPTIASGYLSFSMPPVSQSIIGQTATVSINEKIAGIGLSCGASGGGLNLAMSDTITSRTALYSSVANDPTLNVRYDVGTIDKKFKIQLEIGSSVTTWTPYSNICPISGHDSVTVTRTGKNLLAKPFLIGVHTTSGYNPNNRNVVSTDGFFVKSGVYVLSFSSAVSGSLYVNRMVSESTTDASYQKYYGAARIITIPDDGLYNLQLNGTNISDDIEGINATAQLEIGSTATAYEPYAGNTYTIQLGDTVYGGTLDVTQGKMVVDRAMVDLGTLTWNKISTSGSHWRFWAYLNDMVYNGEMLSSQYKHITPTQSYMGEGGIASQASGSSYLAMVTDERFSDAATFKAAMTGVQLVYELATPIEITLTPTQIDMLLGENNLWADAGDLTLTYYADGNASTSEALGILLGGTYNNPGGADDVSDDEALGILLGGS